MEGALLILPTARYTLHISSFAKKNHFALSNSRAGVAIACRIQRHPDWKRIRRDCRALLFVVT